ncbi:MAG TPA: hypothetical protein HPQ04_01025 [Rhodospirillaceae bacterium]|nr:hypothetical protein [Rhodospirillaceae bacterium]
MSKDLPTDAFVDGDNLKLSAPSLPPAADMVIEGPSSQDMLSLGDFMLRSNALQVVALKRLVDAAASCLIDGKGEGRREVYLEAVSEVDKAKCLPGSRLAAEKKALMIADARRPNSLGALKPAPAVRSGRGKGEER